MVIAVWIMRVNKEGYLFLSLFKNPISLFTPFFLFSGGSCRDFESDSELSPYIYM